MRLYLLLPLFVLTAFPTPAPGLQDTKKTVAVLRFDNNTGDERYDNLGPALSSMMISDLSVVEEIQLLERERLDELVGELEFQQSAYVDPASAQSIGMIVGAPGSQIVAVTLESLRGRVEEEAKDEPVDRADRAIGGLLGRGRNRDRPERPPRPAGC